MPTEAEEIRNKIRDEVATMKAERQAKQHRHELLQLAGHIACGIVSSPMSDKLPPLAVAEIAVKLSELIINVTDRALSPIVQMPTGIPGQGMQVSQ